MPGFCSGARAALGASRRFLLGLLWCPGEACHTPEIDTPAAGQHVGLTRSRRGLEGVKVRLQLLAATAAALGVLAASAAPAEIITAKLGGTTENISDRSDFFGLGIGTITDQPFLQTFTVNTGGGNVLNTPTGVSYNSIFGPLGPPYAVSGSLTINGRTFTTRGSDFSSAFSQGDFQILSDDAVDGTRADSSFYLDVTGAGLPQTVVDPYFATLGGATYAFSDFVIDNRNAATDPTAPSEVIGSLNPAYLSITSITSAAPEPGAWALMMTGVALAGAALRRRKIKGALAA